MKQNYRKLGEIVKLIDERNKSLVSTEVLGISIDKEFMPSVANTIGTDLSNYKLLKKNRFACNPMHVGRDERLPVSLYSKENPAIVFPAYFMFEITDNKSVLPEYLMLNFKRSDFDRNCWFRTDGSVRGGITWDDLCEMELPVPDLTEQQRIVNAYNTVDRRIRLLKQINEKLLKFGISLVDKNISKAILLNMTDNEISNTEKSLPNDWSIKSIANFCEKTESGSTPSRTESDYWDKGTIPWVKSGEVHNNITLSTEEYITEKALKETSTKLLPKDTVLMAMYGVTAGEVGYLNIEATTNQAICGMICKSTDDAAYLYFSLLQNQEQISSMSNGGAQNNLSKNFIENLKIVGPTKEVLEKMNLSLLVKQLKQNYEELKKMENLRQVIISRISGM